MATEGAAEVTGGSDGLSRRKFLIGGVAAAALLATPGAIIVLSGRGGPRAFALYHADDISLWVGNGAEFVVKVRKSGNVIETYTGVTADTFDKLDSEHFTIEATDVPALLEVDVGELDIEFFLDRVDGSCAIAFADGMLEFAIAGVDKAKGEDRRDETFSVVFKGGEGYLLPQGTYEITFDKSTVVPVFIVPIAENTYEAVFTRLAN